MQLKNTFILILCFYFVNGYSQNKVVSTDKGLHVPYDTINLKKGYFLIFEKTDSHRYLRLKGQSVDTIIRQLNIKAPESNLGNVAMDHDDYFALLLETSCHGITLYEKETGNQIIAGCLLDKDTLQNILYFVDWKDDMKQGIFNMKTMKVELLPPPKTACNFWWECLDSKTITDSLLTIEYYIPPKTKVKATYKRETD